MTISRRWQLYAARALFVTLLLAALAGVWWKATGSDPTPPTLRRLAQVGENFFYALVGTQLALVLVVAPALAAGAIGSEKARGTLVQLLVTDLSAVEIVLGKWASRLIPVLGLVAGALPVLFLATLLGGIDPGALLGAFLVTLGVAVLGCALALTLSVWSTRTHEVLLAVYCFWTILLLVNPFWSNLSWFRGVPLPPVWLDMMNPFWLVFAPYASPGTTRWSDYGAFLGVALGLSALLLVVAALCLRRVTLRQACRTRERRPCGDTGGSRKLWWPGPSLDRNPVLWRMWHHQRPSPWTRAMWTIYAVLALGFSLLAILAWVSGSRAGTFYFPAYVSAFQVAIGLLLVSVTGVTALAEERSQGRLEVLLTTPLSTRTIVWGQWWGAYRTVPRLAFLPTLTAAVVITRNDHWTQIPYGLGVLVVLGLVLAYGAALTSLGLALATWIPRSSRAVTLSVGAYVVVTVGWLFVALTLLGDNATARGIASASPWHGILWLTAELQTTGYGLMLALVWGGFWIIIYTAAAALLLFVNGRPR
ncbi:MAG: ABC transporter permease subunit [Gemmataceae bacterium]|nr:ABC transporter permease subunit [Gemmataceae bacterium]